jgi:hypothetical protein
VSSSKANHNSYNPFAVAAESSEQKFPLIVPDTNQSTALKQYQTASPEKSSMKLSKKSAGTSKQAQISHHASKNSQQQTLGTDGSAKVQYKYARKSIGASTTATGAANTSTKVGGAQLVAAGAGPPPLQPELLSHGARTSLNALNALNGGGKNNRASRNSVLFKLSETKYTAKSRFCDLQSSSSNESSKDNDGRAEDEGSNGSDNFDEKIIVADEDMQVRNNFTSSFLDYDLLLGGGQRRKHEPEVYK